MLQVQLWDGACLSPLDMLGAPPNRWLGRTLLPDDLSYRQAMLMGRALFASLGCQPELGKGI